VRWTQRVYMRRFRKARPMPADPMPSPHAKRLAPWAVGGIRSTLAQARGGQLAARHGARMFDTYTSAEYRMRMSGDGGDPCSAWDGVREASIERAWRCFYFLSLPAHRERRAGRNDRSSSS